MKTLVIVDIQNDFITGSLANKDAQAIVEPICDLVKDFNGDIICTLDTHDFNYLTTQEGQRLPVEHCIKGSEGWNLHPSIYKTLKENNKQVEFLEKDTFGALNWSSLWNSDTVVFVGTCTDICVIVNTMMVKTRYPDKRIIVISDLCAGVTKEKHEAALEVMRSCQCDVMTLQEYLENVD